MGPRPRAVRVAQAELFGLAGRELTMSLGDPVEQTWDLESAFARVQVVVSSDRRRRQMEVGPIWESAPDGGADVLPDERVGEFGFDLSGAAVHGEQRFEHDEHEPGILTASAAMAVVSLGNDGCEFVGGGVGEDRVETLERADRTDTHRRLCVLVVGSGPVPSHDPRRTIKTPHT